jgi:hypothetical protein
MAWLGGSTLDANGQTVPWDVFADPFSSSVCDVVNVANAELVVIAATGELAIVSGADRIFGSTFVDSAGDVFFGDVFVGSISFETDGDGFRTLWWTSLTGRVVEVDGFTGEPFESDLFPDDFVDVPCDACDFWDDQIVCEVVEPPPTVSLCGVDVVLPSTVLLVSLGLMSASRRRIPFRNVSASANRGRRSPETN